MQRGKLRLLTVELAGQLIDAGIQRLRQGVSAVCRVFHATHGGLFVEVELAVVELADLGQALAERIEPGGLGLQLAQLHRQCIDIPLGILAHAGQLRILLLHLLAQLANLGQGAVARTGDGHGHGATQSSATEHGCCREPNQAKT